MPRFTTSDGISLHFTDEGEGLPILCLSGLSRNGKDFDYVAPLLDGVRLIRLDYRGRGQSDWAPHETYSIPVEGRDAVELLDHLGIEKAAVLGSSRGGLIAMGLAATVKDRLLGVALNDIGPEIADKGLDVIKDYLGRRPVWKTMEAAIAARPKAMAGFANVPPERWKREAETHYREVEGGLDITYDPKLRDAVLADGAQVVPDLWPFFDALKTTPLLLIRGALTDLLSLDTVAKMHQRHDNMTSVNVPDVGHAPLLTEDEAWSALSDFFKGE